MKKRDKTYAKPSKHRRYRWLAFAAFALFCSGRAHAQETAFRLRPMSGPPGLGYHIPELCSFAECAPSMRLLPCAKKWRFGGGLQVDGANQPLTITQTGMANAQDHLVAIGLTTTLFVVARLPRWLEVHLAFPYSVLAGDNANFPGIEPGNDGALEFEADGVVALPPVSEDIIIALHARLAHGGGRAYRGGLWLAGSGLVRIPATRFNIPLRNLAFSATTGWTGSPGQEHDPFADFQAPRHYLESALGVTWTFRPRWLVRGEFNVPVPLDGLSNENRWPMTLFIGFAYMGSSPESQPKPPAMVPTARQPSVRQPDSEPTQIIVDTQERSRPSGRGRVLDLEAWSGGGVPPIVQGVGEGWPRIRFGGQILYTSCGWPSDTEREQGEGTITGGSLSE